jgi:hypothetical protein
MRRAPIPACLLIVVVTFAIGGCATPLSSKASAVREADESMVAGCTYLGDVAGTSGWGNLAASAGIENAKHEAMEKAAALGATHIVWRSLTGGYSPTATGRAYRCP